MNPALTMDPDERDVGLRVLLELLERMEARCGGDIRSLKCIWRARDKVSRTRTAIRAHSGEGPLGRDISLAQELLGRVEHVLSVLKARREELEHDPRSTVSRSAYLHEFQKVQALYMDATVALFEKHAAEAFEQAERAAERLPRALLEVDLTRITSRPASAVILESSRAELSQWVSWLQKKLDLLEEKGREVGQARGRGGADIAPREQALHELQECIQLTVEAMSHWEQVLEACSALITGGNILPTAYSSVGRLVARCREMKEAAIAGRLETLRVLVNRHRDDPDVTRFLRGLPVIVAGSHLLVGLGITLVASITTAGVSGLFSSVLTTARAGAGLTFVGTVTVESLTFTTVSRSLQASVPGETPDTSFWAELGWNLGLFSAMRGLSTGLSALTRNRGLPLLAEASIQKVGAFGLLQAYGGLQQRVALGRWPTEDEWRTMTAHNIVLMAGLAVGLHAVEGVLPRLGANSALARFARTYQARFSALAAVRGQVETTYRALQTKARPTPGEVETLRLRARLLEDEFRKLLTEVMKDARINLQMLRGELARANNLAEEASAELLARLLDVADPQDGFKSLGVERQYSYAWGRTNSLEKRFREQGAEVRKSLDPDTRLRLLRVRFGQDEPLTLVERTSPYPAKQEVEIDPKAPEVRKLFAEFAITTPQIQRYVLRDITLELSRNPKAGLSGPIKTVSRTLRLLKSRGGQSIEEQLREERDQGRLHTNAESKLVEAASQLEARGILSSNQWMDARSDQEFHGIVGEWLAKQEVLSSQPIDTHVLANIHFRGQLFEDSNMARPHGKNAGGLIDVAPELDLLIANKTNERFQYSQALNVKVADPQSNNKFRAIASEQNRLALEALRAHQEGTVLRITKSQGQVLFGQVSEIIGQDARTGATVNLTHRIEASPKGVTAATMLPKTSNKSEASDMTFTYRDITTITALLLERGFKQSPEF